MKLTSFDYEVEKSLKKLVKNETPILIIIEIVAHNHHIGNTHIGELPIVNSDGLYKIKGANCEFSFTCLECHFENNALIIAYDIGYKPHLTTFMHSSMA